MSIQASDAVPLLRPRSSAQVQRNQRPVGLFRFLFPPCKQMSTKERLTLSPWCVCCAFWLRGTLVCYHLDAIVSTLCVYAARVCALCVAHVRTSACRSLLWLASERSRLEMSTQASVQEKVSQVWTFSGQVYASHSGLSPSLANGRTAFSRARSFAKNTSVCHCWPFKSTWFRHRCVANAAVLSTVSSPARSVYAVHTLLRTNIQTHFRQSREFMRV